jgi:splicing factor U2AF subunit
MLLPNMYLNPAHDPSCTLNAEQLQNHFDLFYEDLFIELAKYGQIEELKVCDNIGMNSEI